jgi:hypothetical protein
MLFFEKIEHIWLLYAAVAGSLLLSFLYLQRRLRLLTHRYTALRRELLKLACFAVAIVGLLAAWLEPRLEQTTYLPVFESLEVIIMLDITDSMRAVVGSSDPRPRYEVMVEAADRILSQFDEDRRAIAAFTTAILHWSPLTRDYERLVRPEIARLANPRVYAEYGFGTNFASAIRGCLHLFEQRERQRVCILLTDGEPEGDMERLAADLIEALEEVALARVDHDISFYLIGIGDPREAQPIPIYNYDSPDTFTGYRTLASGEPIMTRPDHRYLSQMAESLAGMYFSIEDEASLAGFIDEIVGLEREAVAQEEVSMGYDLGLPLLLAVLLAALGGNLLLVFPGRSA